MVVTTYRAVGVVGAVGANPNQGRPGGDNGRSEGGERWGQ